MTEERELRAVLAGAYPDGEPGDDCPSPERWLEWSEGEVEEAEARRMDEHRQHCGVCAAEARLARSFATAGSELGASEWTVAHMARALERASPLRRSTPAAVGRWLAAAAVILLAVGATQLWRASQAPLPEPIEDSVVRGAELRLETELGERAEAPDVLAWTPVDGAARYRVDLSRIDGRVVWQAESLEPSVSLPEELRGSLERAAPYRVTVAAFDETGSELARSSAERLTLTVEEGQ